MAFTLPDLPYSFGALEPYIDAKTMEIHHDKHHGGYVSKLNAALEKIPALANASIDEVIRRLETIPQEIRAAVRNNAGGHYNHSFFWPILKPKADGKPSGSLLTAIEKSFGSFDSFKEKFSTAAAGLFGSGWAWLGIDAEKKPVIITTPNQDPPVLQRVKPVIGLDVWEHAYYLKYQNKRPDYIAAFWNIVNWDQAARNYEEAMG